MNSDTIVRRDDPTTRASDQRGLSLLREHQTYPPVSAAEPSSPQTYARRPLSLQPRGWFPLRHIILE